MVSEEEKAFVKYWEENRNREKRFFYQLLIGLPLGLIFTLPILINYLAGWDKRATMVGNAQLNPGLLITAVIIIAVFFAVFSKRHRWEMQEQRYLEIREKMKDDVNNG